MDSYLKDYYPGNLADPMFARFFFACTAMLTYKTPAVTEKYFKQAGFIDHNLVSINGAQCYVLISPKIVVISFRGTEPKEFSDIKADLKLWKTDSETEGSVHAGFKHELDKVWPNVLTYIQTNRDKPLYITGHSLGAPMATIAVSRVQKYDNFRSLYTYGSPTVGNKRFLTGCTFSHVIVQNNNDIVTQTPPMLLGYRHHVPSTYINYYGNIRKLTKWQKVKDMFRGRWRAIQKFEFFDGILDHNMDKYCKNLHQQWNDNASNS